MGKRSRRNADASQEATRQFPAFMQAQQNTRTKSVARACRAGDEFLRQPQRRLPDVLAFARAGKGAFRKMHDHHLADTLLQQGDDQAALDLFQNILDSDPAYRDVQSRVSDLRSRRDS